MKRILLIGALSCFFALTSGHVMAENTDVNTLKHAIYIDSFTVPQGTTEYTLSVKMRNEYEVKGFSFAIFLPEGFTFSTTNGTPDAQLSTVRTNSTHIDAFSANIQSDGALYVNANAQKGDGEIIGDDGEVALVKILFPENATAGDYAIIVKNLSINLYNGDDAVTEGYGAQEFIESTLTIDAGLFLDEDNTDPNAIEAATDVNVTVKRTIKANQWSTICLPFAMTETQTKAAFGDDVQIADFTGCEATYDEATGENIVALKLNFDNVTAMDANHPYIIKVGSDVAEFSVEGVDITPSDELSVDRDEDKYKRNGRWYYDYNSFIGTYEAGTEIPENALFLSGNKFWYSVGKTTTKAFRGYFLFYMVLSDVVTADTRISLWFDDDETTGISNVRGKKDNVRCEVYDLLGRRIENPTKGLYIRNGRKEVVK